MLIGLVEFKIHWIDGVYDLGVMMGLIPLVLCVQGRWGPYLMLLPITLLPIAGKTLRALVDPAAFSVTWLAYLILPMLLATTIAVWFARQAKPEGEHPLFIRCALLFCVWIFHDLNFAFFDFLAVEGLGRPPSECTDLFHLHAGHHPHGVFLQPRKTPLEMERLARRQGLTAPIDHTHIAAVRICRYMTPDNQVRIGLAKGDDALLDLTAAGVESITSILESTDPKQHLTNLSEQDLPEVARDNVSLLSPIEVQEVWAAGVTYLRSKDARMEESDFSATAYDRVYDAPRPEIFFKSLPEKVVACGEPVGIRADAKWNVPEPELVLMMNSRGDIAGYAVGNDMSSRDIEGENLLYLPQAKGVHTAPAPSALG